MHNVGSYTRPVDLDATTRTRLHALSQRATPTRLRLVAAIAAAGRPISITEILEQEPTFAQSSTYRNLQVLEQAGVLHRIVTNDTARYELAEDLAGHHHHLMCERCGAVIDVAMPNLERAVHDAADAAAASHGFTTRAHRVDLVGTCAQCRGARER